MSAGLVDGALLRDLPVLVALWRTGSVSAAADELAIPQPTATRALQRLSAALGTPVTSRHGRGVQLTHAGQVLAEAGAVSLTTISHAAAAITHGRTIEAMNIGIAFQTLLGEMFVPEVIRRFRTQWPAASFRFEHGARATCIEALRAGRVDVALVADPPATREHSITALYSEPLVAVVAADHELATATAVSVEQASLWPQIMLTAGYGVRDAVHRLYAAAGDIPPAALEVGEYRAARGLAAAGLGVAILPPSPTFVDDGAREIPIRHPLAHRRIAALSHHRPGAGIRELITVMIAAAARKT